MIRRYFGILAVMALTTGAQSANADDFKIQNLAMGVISYVHLTPSSPLCREVTPINVEDEDDGVKSIQASTAPGCPVSDLAVSVLDGPDDMVNQFDFKWSSSPGLPLAGGTWTLCYVNASGPWPVETKLVTDGGTCRGGGS